MLNRRDVIITGLLSAALPGDGARAQSEAWIEVSVPPGATAGTLSFGVLEYPCVVGRSGIRIDKREGDGATPAGTFPLREVRYRADRLARPVTGLSLIETKPFDGWCDDPADPAYNRLVTLPYPHSAEAMWREDHVYDVLAVIGTNDAPPLPGRGSAIFLHVMHDDASPTAGCISLKRDDLLAVLAHCSAETMIQIGA